MYMYNVYVTMCKYVYIHVRVYSSCSAQKGQHEPCKGECCSCLGTATNLLDIYVKNVRSYTNRLQTILCSTVA